MSRATLVVRLHDAQDPAEQRLQLASLGSGQRVEKVAVAGGRRGDGCIDQLDAPIGQLDDHAAAVVRVRQARDEPALLETIQPARDARRTRASIPGRCGPATGGAADRGPAVRRARRPRHG